MAAPYRANHQHNIKTLTSEDSKRSAERALIGASLLSGCRKAIEELPKKINYKAVSERNALHRFCCKKIFELFGDDHFFIQIIFRELGNQF